MVMVLWLGLVLVLGLLILYCMIGVDMLVFLRVHHGMMVLFSLLRWLVLVGISVAFGCSSDDAHTLILWLLLLVVSHVLVVRHLIMVAMSLGSCR